MRSRAFMLLLLLSLVGAPFGYLAGPFFARASDTVRLAARVWEEDSEGLTERTFESEAFRATGRPAAELYDQARLVEHRMKVGGALFGAWCGLVIGLNFCGLIPVRKQETYEIEHAWCVACGRCFLSCPRERLRLKKLAQRAGEDPSSAGGAS